MREPKVVIVDYGMGNLYNVARACSHVGLSPTISTEPTQVAGADLAILPGVGAMPDAMIELERTGLADALRERAAADRPVLGVCLGLQLLMSEGTEFTAHSGLGIVPGRVVRFPSHTPEGQLLRVPHIGWTAVNRPSGAVGDPWRATPLVAIPDGCHMYFVHSYYVVPADPSHVAAVSRYGPVEFCSAVRYRNVFACQFHPERSGPDGIAMYSAFAAMALSS